MCECSVPRKVNQKGLFSWCLVILIEILTGLLYVVNRTMLLELLVNINFSSRLLGK